MRQINIEHISCSRRSIDGSVRSMPASGRSGPASTEFCFREMMMGDRNAELLAQSDPFALPSMG